MTELTKTSALDLSKALAQKDLSVAELMVATLDRIDAVNDRVNAIVSLRDRDDLIAEAQVADQSARTGWLHGIPIAIKDLANAKGFPTSKGSPLFAGQMPENDDIMVARLREAGAIVIGKTNTPEFGLGSHTFNPVHGATENPYAPGLSCGGSSGGAAVALATGMLSVADGSDMMGSLRNPAGWNNVYGMRPSWGLVPSEPLGDTFLHQLSTNGPMARNPRDLAALLDTMAGPDHRQPHGVSQPSSLEQIDQNETPIRIGWLRDWGGAIPFEAGILELCETALHRFEDLGCRVDVLDAPFSREQLWDSWTKLRNFSVSTGLGELASNPEHRSYLKATALWEIEQGQHLSAQDVHNESVVRSNWFTTCTQLFENYDALILPTAQVWPFDVRQPYPTQIAGVDMDTYHRWMEVVVPASLIGLPVVAVPAGFGGPNDTPMGLQLMGARGADAKLLALAERWHQATDWPNQRPVPF
ncbi:MAG: amidase [Paracoccaceae bacterium]